MSKTKELIKNTVILSIGRFCTQLISFILVPIYTHYLSTSDYGYVDLIQTYISLIVPIVILRLDAGVFRFLIECRKDKNEQKKIISNIAIVCTFLLLISSSAFILLSFFLSIEMAIYIFFNAISIAISNLLLQTARGLGENRKYSIASLIAGITTLLFSVTTICVFHFGGSGILLSASIGNILCALYLLVTLRINKKVDLRQLNRVEVRNLLRYSIPMIPDGLSWWVVGVSDRTIISAVLGTAANGIYAISSKFSNVLFSIFQVFNMSWQENASLHINDKDNNEYFTNILNTTHKLFFSICYLLLGAMPFIFMIMVGDNYSEAYQYVPILLFANLLNTLANTTGAVYIAKKKSSSAAKTTLAAAIINIIINLLFVRTLGLYAAAISTLISYALLALYRYYDVQKYVKMKIDGKFFIVSTIIFMASSIIYMRNNIILNIINLLVITIVCIFINKQLIKKTAKRIIDKIAKRAL